MNNYRAGATSQYNRVRIAECDRKPGLSLLSLCDYSGVWSKPYREAGWKVIQVDIALNGLDVLKFDVNGWVPNGVLAAPPCTCFCRPAARWWSRQDADGSTLRDIAIFRRCLEIAKLASDFWALENPPGRHRKLIPELGPPSWQYQPSDYGDAWWKQTYIWGTARKPAPTNVVTPAPTRRTPNGHTQGRIAFMSSTWKRQREQTPAGFARAFFEANH